MIVVLLSEINEFEVNSVMKGENTDINASKSLRTGLNHPRLV